MYKKKCALDRLEGTFTGTEKGEHLWTILDYYVLSNPIEKEKMSLVEQAKRRLR